MSTSITITTKVGMVPIGGVMPIMSNITGSYTIPATGTVDDDGWMYCDGSAIPGGNTLSGNVPNLTDNRFLLGATSAGTTGGANSITPAGSLSGTQNIDHSHNIAHHHKWGELNGQDMYGLNAASNSATTITTGSYNWGIAQSFGTTSGPFLNALRPTSVTNSLYTTGVLSPPTGSSGSSASSSSAGGTVSFSNGTFTGTSFNNRPLYVACQYIIRVK